MLRFERNPSPSRHSSSHCCGTHPLYHCCAALQLLFQNASPAYLVALEDKGIFGARRPSGSKSTAALPTTVPAWVHMQATEYGCELDVEHVHMIFSVIRGRGKGVAFTNLTEYCPPRSQIRSCHHTGRFGGDEMSPLALKISSPSSDLLALST